MQARSPPTRKPPQSSSPPLPLDCDIAAQPLANISAHITAEAHAHQQSAEKHTQLAASARMLAAAIAKCMAVAEDQAATVTAICECISAQDGVSAAVIVLRGCCEDGPLQSALQGHSATDCKPSSSSFTTPSTSNKMEKMTAELDATLGEDPTACESEYVYQHEWDWDALTTCMHVMHVAESSDSGYKGPLSLQDLRAVLEPARFDKLRVQEILEALEASGTSLVARLSALQQLLSGLTTQRCLLERDLHEMLTRGEQINNSIWPLIHAQYQSVAVGAEQTPSQSSLSSVSRTGKCPFMHSAAQQPTVTSLAERGYAHQPGTSRPQVLLSDTVHAEDAAVHGIHQSSSRSECQNAGTSAHMHEDHAWLLPALHDICAGVLPFSTGTGAFAAKDPAPASKVATMQGWLGILQPTGAGVCPVTGLSSARSAGQTPESSHAFHVSQSPIVEELDQDELLHRGVGHDVLEQCSPQRSNRSHVTPDFTSMSDHASGVSTKVSQDTSLCPLHLHPPSSPKSTAVYAPKGESTLSASTLKLPPQAIKSGCDSASSIESVVEAVRFSKKVAKKHQQLVELYSLRLQGCLEAVHSAVQLNLAQADATRFVCQQQVCVYIYMSNIIPAPGFHAVRCFIIALRLLLRHT